MAKHKLTKATDITQKVKKKVLERDGHCCILCGSTNAQGNAHYIPRSQLGLGIEENVWSACLTCHHDYDNGDRREEYGIRIENYLKSRYTDWDKSKLVYSKFDY